MAYTTIEKTKGFSKNNGNGNEYKFYKIEGKVEEVGVIYCLDIAVKNYLNHHHGGQFKIVESSEKHGDCYSSLIAVKGEFNVERFRYSVNNSGRQAKDEGLKTTIDVLSIDSQKFLMDEVKDDYRKKLNIKEQEIAALKGLIDERAKSLEEKTKEINSLEFEIRNRPKLKFDNLLESILEGYIGNNEDLMYNIVEDYRGLKRNGDVEVFLKQSLEEKKLSYLNYLNNKYDLNLLSEEEFSLFLKRKEEEKDWDMTARGKELARLEQLCKNDCSLLELVKLSGFTDEMISSVKSVVERNRHAEAQKSIEEYKIQFENEKKIYAGIGDSKLKYEKFKEISERAEKRKSKKLPVLIHEQRDQLRIYAPLALGDDELQKELGEILFYNAGDEFISFTQRVYSESVAKFSVLPNSHNEMLLHLEHELPSKTPCVSTQGSSQNGELNNLVKRMSKSITDNRIINALCGGIEPIVKDKLR